jgi:membrane protein implicated in regulation of membrane protease activity
MVLFRAGCHDLERIPTNASVVVVGIENNLLIVEKN